MVGRREIFSFPLLLRIYWNTELVQCSDCLYGEVNKFQL